jgi:hypothetical protein
MCIFLKVFLQVEFPQRLEAATGWTPVTARVELVPFPGEPNPSFSADYSCDARQVVSDADKLLTLTCIFSQVV